MLKPKVFRIKNSLFSFNGLSNFPASFSNREIPVSVAIVNTPPTTSSKPEPTTAEQLPCPDGFTTVAEGWCFLVVQETKTWDNAEAHCQTFGQHVHLAGLEKQEVGISLFEICHCFCFVVFFVCGIKLLQMINKIHYNIV